MSDERIAPEVIEAAAKALRERALRNPDGATAEIYAEASDYRAPEYPPGHRRRR